MKHISLNIDHWYQLALTLLIQYVFYKHGADRHLIACEVDLVDLCKDLEGGPGQTGEQVAGKQENLKTERK